MKPLQTLTELEAINPVKVREYCYRDGEPTDWVRQPLTEKQVESQRIPYYCNQCQDRGYFVLQREKRK